MNTFCDVANYSTHFDIFQYYDVGNAYRPTMMDIFGSLRYNIKPCQK